MRYFTIGHKLRGILSDVGERKQKFIGSFNNVVANGYFMSEECIVEVLVKQCIPVLMYAAGMWAMNVEEIRRVGVCLNRSVRKIFNYRDFESVKDVMYGFYILPADLAIIRANMLLIGACLKSNRKAVVACAEWQREREIFVQRLVDFGVNYRLDRASVNDRVWHKFSAIVEWVHDFIE